jgi:CRP/FNR family cyclic AMP-dependent transcriptional regulator
MVESDYLEKNKELLNDLRKIPTLQPFNESELNSLIKMSKIKRYKPGEYICKEGHHDSWIYFLVDGEVQIVKNKKKLTVLKRRGEVFGEMGAIDGSPRSATVYAVDNTTCLATDSFYIEKLAGQEKIAFGYILYKIFAEILAVRLRTSNRKLLKVSPKWDFRNIFAKILPSYS